MNHGFLEGAGTEERIARPLGDRPHDLDLAGLGIVKVLADGRGDSYPDLPWEPKAAFAAVADHHRD
ncbi:hypothetical protein [Streptodolium elevatio]|uniref:Uncharacterized protein n=1 Tax=Streptodolium elevatio TaxID=3157996 RepID=A0ABV3DTG5_9ACTN